MWFEKNEKINVKINESWRCMDYEEFQRWFMEELNEAAKDEQDDFKMLMLLAGALLLKATEKYEGIKSIEEIFKLMVDALNKSTNDMIDRDVEPLQMLSTSISQSKILDHIKEKYNIEFEGNK